MQELTIREKQLFYLEFLNRENKIHYIPQP